MAGPFVTSADVKAALARKANQPPTAGTAGQVLQRDPSSTTGTSWVTPAVGGSGAADATPTANGLVRLAGDLAGTAAAPTLRQLFPAQQTAGSSTVIPVPTVDVSGRVVALTTAAVSVDPAVLDGLVADLVNRAGSAARAAVQAAAGGSSSATLTNTTTPSITGTAQVGQTLTANPGAWSATPDTYAYRWTRAGTAVPGATASTYAVQAADAGQQVAVTVTAYRSGYASGTAASGPVVPTAAGGTQTYRLLTASGNAITTASGAYILVSSS